MTKEHKLVNGKKVYLTEKEILDNKIESLLSLEETKANEYIVKRQESYPSLEDQLDEIFHFGIESWKTNIQAIKDLYPKPE